MDRLSELEDRVDMLERSRPAKIVASNNDTVTTLSFSASSYAVDVEIDVMMTGLSDVEVTYNGVTTTYHSNMITLRLATERVNTLVVNVIGGGLISKRIRIEGIGVKLLTL